MVGYVRTDRGRGVSQCQYFADKGHFFTILRGRLFWIDPQNKRDFRAENTVNLLILIKFILIKIKKLHQCARFETQRFTSTQSSNARQ